jgi:hypothetical protein
VNKRNNNFNKDNIQEKKTVWSMDSFYLRNVKKKENSREEKKEEGKTNLGRNFIYLF